MGIQINGNTNNINAGIGSLSIEDINELDIVGVATAANFKTGVSNLHSLGLTLSGGQLDVGSNIKIGTAGVITATSFVGSGANLTSLPAQATIANNADNRVITGGSGVNLNGEANLTFDGSNVIHAGGDGRRYSFAGGGTSHYMKFDTTLNGIILNGYGGIAFETNGTNERLRITSTGQLLVGTGSASNRFKNGNGNGATPKFQFETANVDEQNDISLTFGRNNAFGAEIILAKHRASTVGGVTVVQSGDRLGGINFAGSDGTHFHPAALIQGRVDGTPGTGDMPGRLEFLTTADGASTPTERLRIKSDGEVNFASDAVFTNSSWTGNKAAKIQHHNNWLYMQAGTSGIKLRSSNGSDETIFSGRKIDIEGGRNSSDDALVVHMEDNRYRKIQLAEATVSHAVGTYGGFIGYDASNNYMTLGTNQAGTVHEGMRFHRSGGYVTKPTQPCCMAYNAQGQHMSGGAIAQFNSTRFNIGSHYNSSNGRFTAPIAGRYLVAYSGLHDYQGQSYAGFTIRLNGSDFDGGEAYDQVYGTSSSEQCQLAKTLILNMSTNDYVQIYIRSSGTQVHQRYGSFSVCLLT